MPVDYDPPMNLPGYRPEPRRLVREQIKQVIARSAGRSKPIIYVGGGIITPSAAAELLQVRRARPASR